MSRHQESKMFLSGLWEEETISTCHKSFTNWEATVDSQSDSLARTSHPPKKEAENLIDEPHGEKEKDWRKGPWFFSSSLGESKREAFRQVKSHFFLSGPPSVYLENTVISKELCYSVARGEVRIPLVSIRRNPSSARPLPLPSTGLSKRAGAPSSPPAPARTRPPRAARPSQAFPPTTWIPPPPLTCPRPTLRGLSDPFPAPHTPSPEK